MIQVYKRLIKVNLGDNQGNFYMASFSRKGTANSVTLANEMKEGSSAFTKGEVVGVTLDLPARIKQALLDGKAVEITGLGTFKPSLTVAELKAEADELKTSAISIKGLNFRPDSELLTDLNSKAEYQWISAEKANKEDAADNTADDSSDTDGTSDDTNTGDDSQQSGGSSDTGKVD